MWLSVCVQQRVESEKSNLGTADSNGVAGGCKQGDVVFYQETQKGGASTLIAQISRPGGGPCTVCLLHRDAQSREQAQTSEVPWVYQVSLRATCFIITYYRIERFHRAAACGQTFTALCFDPADVTNNQVYGIFAKRAICVCRQTPIQPYFCLCRHLLRNAVQYVLNDIHVH